MNLFVLIAIFLASFFSVEPHKPADFLKAHAAASADYFYLPVGGTPASRVSEQDCTNIIADFQREYSLQVYKETGLPLVIFSEWSSPYFAAFSAKRDSYYQISLWGGMARAPGASRYTVIAVLCHELGHILGGAPMQSIPGAEWASTEGQSDLFAAKVCLPRYFLKHPEEAPVQAVQSEITEMCHGQIPCARSAQAGWELINLFQRYSFHEFVPVSLSVHEKPVQELIRNSYPSDQCRLDTYLQGASCQVTGLCGAPLCWAGLAPQEKTAQ